MSRRQLDGEAIFVERGPRLPLRIWIYFLMPAVIGAAPAPFLGTGYWAAAGGILGSLLFMSGISVLITARRHWWITIQDLRLSRLPLLARVFYGSSGERCIPLSGIEKIETAEGNSLQLQRTAFGSLKAAGQRKQSSLGSSLKPWCKAAVIVRLSQPDEYGDVVLLSTNRPQEASSILIRTINDEKQRRGTAP